MAACSKPFRVFLKIYFSLRFTKIMADMISISLAIMLIYFPVQQTQLELRYSLAPLKIVAMGFIFTNTMSTASCRPYLWVIFSSLASIIAIR